MKTTFQYLVGITILAILCLVYIFALRAEVRKKTKPSPMNLSQAIERVRPSIVQITYTASDFPPEVWRQLGRPFVSGALGTGFLVNSDGHVVTARHVIDEGRALLERIPAGRKQMSVGLALPNTENMRGNFVLVEFDVVEEDIRHDLALLKLRRNPFKGEVTSGIKIGEELLALPVAASALQPERPQDGIPVAISGYPLHQPVLVTNAGWMASSWSFDVAQVQAPGAPDWFRIPDVGDSFLADVETNRGNSGGPVYRVETGTVIGVCVASKPAPVRDQNGQNIRVNDHELLYSSGLTVVVPIRYVIDMLRKHDLSYQPEN